MKPSVVGIVGATGMVGREAVAILEKRPTSSVKELKLFATNRSLGTQVPYRGAALSVMDLATSDQELKKCDGVLFCVEASIAQELGPKVVAGGSWVVDNSSAFRLDPATALVCPQVNGNKLDELKKSGRKHLIANPNCSTIQLVMPLKALHDAFGLEDVLVSTYQAVSGAGKDAMETLFDESQTLINLKKESQDSFGFHRHYGEKIVQKNKALPQSIGMNLFPQIGSFNSSGFCEEEIKIMRETCKILDLPKLPVVATTVRVPVLNSHSESVMVRLKETPRLEEVKKVFKAFQGLEFFDTLQSGDYPTPAVFSGKDTVGVGRLRVDPFDPRRLHFWVVADNLRIGAALNAVTILERLLDNE